MTVQNKLAVIEGTDRDAAVREAISVIRVYTPLGKVLLDWMDKVEMGCFVASDKSLGGALGRYGYKDGCRAVLINENNSMADNMSIIPHEIMHAIQDKVWKMLRTDHNNDFRSALIYTLSLEAAAETCAVRVCYQAKLNGDDRGYTTYMEDKSGCGSIMEVFERTYKQSIAQSGKHKSAAREAGQEAFHAYYKNAERVEAYGEMLLYSYAKAILTGHKDKHVQQRSLGAAYIKQLTQLGDGEFLINEVNFPTSDRELFKGNDPLRQVCDYIDYCRSFSLCGGSHTDLDVQWKRAQLRDDKNPYLRIPDLRKVVASYEEQKESYMAGQGKEFPDMLEIMNMQAGVYRSTQIALDFSAAELPANNNLPKPVVAAKVTIDS